MPEPMGLSVIIVAGARPQFIKCAPLAAALRKAGDKVQILHTGQHYDAGMSDVFFEELNIPAPEWNLGCGGGTHGQMTGAMLAGVEGILMTNQPDWVVVFGDTNSTLAGALAAAKLNLPLAHVEAGVRSHNRRMPEEINRICTDHISDLLFCSSEAGREQLACEGVTRGVHVTGDIMADAFLHTASKVQGHTFRFAPDTSPWALLTLHRAENTEFPARLRSIFEALRRWGHPAVFPVHPRTRIVLERGQLTVPANVHMIEPLGFHDMITALLASSVLLTDSGGMQKEALWAGKPCVTLRDETEWVETVEAGWNVVAGAGEETILAALARPVPAGPPPALYGDGRAAARIVSCLQSVSKTEAI
jgi:UDP-GlcNAc3NAcA epimerase